MEKGGQHEKRKLTSMYVPIGEICQQNEEKTFPLRITFQKYSVWHDVQERNLTLLPGHGGASMVAYAGEMEKEQGAGVFWSMGNRLQVCDFVVAALFYIDGNSGI